MQDYITLIVTETIKQPLEPTDPSIETPLPDDEVLPDPLPQDLEEPDSTGTSNDEELDLENLSNPSLNIE